MAEPSWHKAWLIRVSYFYMRRYHSGLRQTIGGVVYFINQSRMIYLDLLAYVLHSLVSQTVCWVEFVPE